MMRLRFLHVIEGEMRWPERTRALIRGQKVWTGQSAIARWVRTELKQGLLSMQPYTRFFRKLNFITRKGCPSMVASLISALSGWGDVFRDRAIGESAAES